MGGPCTASAADISVVARPTKAPEIADCAVTGESQRVAQLPHFCNGHLPDVAACIGYGRERRTTLYRAVGLDTNRRLSRRASLPVAQRVIDDAPPVFVRAKIADAVGGL